MEIQSDYLFSAVEKVDVEMKKEENFTFIMNY